MTNIEQTIREYRDYVNNPRIQSALYADKSRWLQVCSAMDAIGDAELAVHAYTHSELPNESPELYLALFGLFQSMYVQQDAVNNLLGGLNLSLDFDRFPKLSEIREIRNRAFGHPTRYEHGAGTSKIVRHVFLVRATLTKTSFELHETAPSTDSIFRPYDTSAIIQNQAVGIERALKEALDELIKMDREHRLQFRSEHLADSFHPSLEWSLGKIGEAATGSSPQQFARIGLNAAQSSLRDFEARLSRRGLALDTYDSIKYTVAEMSNPLDAIEEWIDGSDRHEPWVIVILVRDLSQKFRELREVAREIDEEYAAD